MFGVNTLQTTKQTSVAPLYYYWANLKNNYTQYFGNFILRYRYFDLPTYVNSVASHVTCVSVKFSKLFFTLMGLPGKPW